MKIKRIISLLLVICLSIGMFSMTVSAAQKRITRPTVTASNIASSGKIKLSWDAVDGAVKYEVYRATSKNGTYKLLITTKNTSINNTSAVAGKTYYYKVRAIAENESANSAYSSVVSRTCDLARPVVKIYTNDNGKTVIDWDKIDGATKYKVYVYNASGKLLKTVTTNGSKMTHTSAVAGTTYKYRVQAIAEKSAANSAKSPALSNTSKLAAPEISIGNVKSSGKIKVTWDAVDGAVKYEIYRATSKNGEFKLMYTTEGTSYTNTSAKAGKTYYYKVKAIAKNESANSEFSATKYRTCDLERPELTVKLSDKKPMVKWNAIDGAKEYKVEVYTGKNLVKTVTTTDTEYVYKNANEGTNYRFKVTALHETSAANSATAESKTISCPNSKVESCNHEWEWDYDQNGKVPNLNEDYYIGRCTKCGYIDEIKGEDSELVHKVLELINEERAAKGLPALEWDSEYEAYAKKRAEEISINFSHDRLDGAMTVTGENIYHHTGGGTAASAVNGWMNSPGHRAAILEETYVGATAARYEGYWIVLFFAEEA